ncbi:MAG: ATPase, T2SS/T4P/T4SS family [Alphaproteobacteria bacterium]
MSNKIAKQQSLNPAKRKANIAAARKAEQEAKEKANSGADPEKADDASGPATITAEDRVKQREEAEARARAEAAKMMERIKAAGDLLTGPGGVYERRPELREIMALFQNGLFLISKSHQDDPHLASFEGLLRRKGMRIQKFAVDMNIIREAYKQAGDLGAARRGDGSSTSMQRDILRFIADCAKLGASDAHVVVDRESCRVRLRVDGVMRNFLEWRAAYGHEFCAATFAMADASDTSYQPYEYQAARVSDSSVRLPGGVQSLRLQFNPLAYGGRHMVVRFLYRAKTAEITDVDVLGYSPTQIESIMAMRMNPMGINIVAGPTGSGKSTTLQKSLSTLMEMRRYEISVFTVEDPPEYVIKGAQQMPVTNANTPEERTIKFNAAINAALRSDPDVIMIGEVRDRESAKLSFEAAMTGHQVWTTLHATDAVTIMGRLLDIGVESYKLYDPGVITGLIGQRLVRVLCPECSVPYKDALDNGMVEDDLHERTEKVLGGDTEGVKVRGAGCSKCDDSGVAGRTVVAEVILPNHRFMRALERGDKLRARNIWIDGSDAETMMEHGVAKVKAGIVSPGEVERVLGPMFDERKERERE